MKAETICLVMFNPKTPRACNFSSELRRGYRTCLPVKLILPFSIHPVSLHSQLNFQATQQECEEMSAKMLRQSQVNEDLEQSVASAKVASWCRGSVKP